MKFPFTFTAIFSILLGLWIVAYLATHPSRDGLLVAIELGSVAMLWIFAAWWLLRRHRHGKEA